MLRGVRGDIVRNDDLVGDILRVLEDRDQARVGVADLVVDRDHDADQRVLFMGERKLPVLAVDVADGEIAFDEVPPFLRGGELVVPYRMQDRILPVIQLLPLHGPLRIFPVEGIARLAAQP